MLNRQFIRRLCACPAFIDVNPLETFKQPLLNGLWEDSVGMRRLYLSHIQKLDGYFVLDRAMRRSYHGNTILRYFNDETTDVIFSAPWGPEAKMRTYMGNVSSCGTKIVWFGYNNNNNNNVEWHLLRKEEDRRR